MGSLIYLLEVSLSLIKGCQQNSNSLFPNADKNNAHLTADVGDSPNPPPSPKVYKEPLAYRIDSFCIPT